MDGEKIMKNKIVAFCISILLTLSLFGFIYLSITYPEVVKAGLIVFVTFLIIGGLYSFVLSILGGD